MKKIFLVSVVTSALWSLAAQAQNTAKLVIPIGHTSSINCVDISPNGLYFLTGSQDQTAKIWNASGREVCTLAGHTKDVRAVAFSPVSKGNPEGGNRILTGSNDYTAILWDVLGNQLCKFVEPNLKNGAITSVAFSPAAKEMLAGSESGAAWLLDDSCKIILKYQHPAELNSVAFSPKGDRILTACANNTAVLWNRLDEKKPLRIFPGHSAPVLCAVFSSTGDTVLTSSADGTAILWKSNGQKIRSFQHPPEVQSVAMSPDGQTVVTGSSDGTIKVWKLTDQEAPPFQIFYRGLGSLKFSSDGQRVLCSSNKKNLAKLCALDGKVVQKFKGHTSAINSLTLSPDGNSLLVGHADSTAKWWDLSSQKIKSFTHQARVETVAFSPKSADDPKGGKFILTGCDNKVSQIWDRAGSIIGSPFTKANKALFFADGKSVLTGNSDGTLKIWDLALNQSLPLAHPERSVTALAISPVEGSKAFAFGSSDGVVVYWDTVGANPVQFKLSMQIPIFTLAFSPDGKTLVSGQQGGLTEIRDLSGNLIKEYPNRKRGTQNVRSARFSPPGIKDQKGGQHVLRAAGSNVERWDWAKAKVDTLASHNSEVVAVALTPDGRYCFSGSKDGTIKFLNLESGVEVATLVSIDSTDWVVTSSTGLFDASPDAMKLLHYMVGKEVVALEQLKTRYYEPYLLQKIMGFKPGGMRPVDELSNVPLYPEVLETGIKDDLLKVRLKARNGGIGKVALELDGFELVPDANPARLADFQLDLKPYLGFFSPDKPNRLSLKLYNEKGWLESQSHVLEHKYDGVSARGDADKPRKSFNDLSDAGLEKIHFYALVVGTSKYSDEKLNLKYPEKDAAIFADALRKAGGKLFKNRVEVQLLSTETEPWPRKAEIRKALRSISAKAGPDDILLVYFSGHGITYPPVSEAGQFYYLTTDIAGDNLKDEVILKTQAVAQDSLMDWVRQVKARKRILIYDACNSGSVVNQFETGAKDLNTDQRRALERMKDRTGMYVLAGSAADKSSYEASNYGHGLLTYSLINGMLAVAAKKHNFVEVGDLFAFVEDDVERLAKNINREQRPEVIKAESYPIGIIDKDTEIKMPTELPVFVRVNLMDFKKNKDLLGLSKTLNDEMDRISSEKNPPFVFWDVESYAGKYYYLGGQYQSESDKVTGTASLYLNDNELKKFPLSGSADALGKLAKDLLFEVQDYLAKHPEH